uniref:Uncharacterized protein n=1 Tax=Romanomermis culicivorax TaxID=13658 RepID=A0A915IPI3_ROMCU
MPTIRIIKLVSSANEAAISSGANEAALKKTLLEKNQIQCYCGSSSGLWVEVQAKRLEVAKKFCALVNQRISHFCNKKFMESQTRSKRDRRCIRMQAFEETEKGVDSEAESEFSNELYIDGENGHSPIPPISSTPKDDLLKNMQKMHEMQMKTPATTKPVAQLNTTAACQNCEKIAADFCTITDLMKDMGQTITELKASQADLKSDINEIKDGISTILKCVMEVQKKVEDGCG